MGRPVEGHRDDQVRVETHAGLQAGPKLSDAPLGHWNIWCARNQQVDPHQVDAASVLHGCVATDGCVLQRRIEGRVGKRLHKADAEILLRTPVGERHWIGCSQQGPLHINCVQSMCHINKVASVYPGTIVECQILPVDRQTLHDGRGGRRRSGHCATGLWQFGVCVFPCSFCPHPRASRLLPAPQTGLLSLGWRWRTEVK